MTNRYVTIENYSGGIKAYTSQDDFISVINHEDTADWVWQFADSPKQAINQHQTKVDEWAADMDAGKPEKPTY